MSGVPTQAAWEQAFELPPPGNMLKGERGGRAMWVRQGNRIFAALEARIERHAERPIAALEILDFGCGNGRVALPFFHKHRKPDRCVDVDAAVIDYLRRVIPDAHPERIDYRPPTRFADGSFDCAYAVSVWTHLPEDLQRPWLREIKRLLRPGGLALISTSGFRALQSRRVKRLPGWAEVSDAELRARGIIFKATGAVPGVTGAYGYTAHDPAWIARHWSEEMDIVEIAEAAIDNVQDLVVMRRRAAAGGGR